MATRKAFLLMPFKLELGWLHEIIVAAGKDVGVEVERADDIFSPGIIIDQVKQRIERADALVAVCTDRNANVFYELGIAEARHKPVLVAADAADLPFDIHHFRAHFYGRDPADPQRTTLQARIAAALIDVLNEGLKMPRTNDLITHVQGHRMIGQRTEPALMFTGIWFENLDNLDSSVQDIVVGLRTPVEAGVRQSMWREANRPVPISNGCNIPRRGKTPEVDITVHFDAALPTASGVYSGEVAAIGPGGAWGDFASFEGSYAISDS
ncbi:MAG: hypothetical protein ACYDEB_04795 [Dehalococcoidia bacterium]